jgi:hypothetical protein
MLTVSHQISNTMVSPIQNNMMIVKVIRVACGGEDELCVELHAVVAYRTWPYERPLSPRQRKGGISGNDEALCYAYRLCFSAVPSCRGSFLTDPPPVHVPAPPRGRLPLILPPPLTSCLASCVPPFPMLLLLMFLVLIMLLLLLLPLPSRLLPYQGMHRPRCKVEAVWITNHSLTLSVMDHTTPHDSSSTVQVPNSPPLSLRSCPLASGVMLPLIVGVRSSFRRLYVWRVPVCCQSRRR